MNFSSVGIRVTSLMLFGLLVALAPAATIASGTGSQMDAWLMERGLIGHARFGDQSSRGLMVPPVGVEVDETRQSVKQTGQVLMRVKSWNEIVGDDTVHIEVSILPDNQYSVGFWLLPTHLPGCTMFEWTLFENSRAL